ncbi:hypothetical protein E2I59_05625 [Campylobacter jejuni]|nr:hypothetical protein [Campylobacter jejuni]
MIVGISNYLLRWYYFLLLLCAISRQKSTVCCDIALSKNNRLILNTKVEARIINNFEHYYLIASNKINTTPLFEVIRCSY